MILNDFVEFVNGNCVNEWGWEYLIIYLTYILKYTRSEVDDATSVKPLKYDWVVTFIFVYFNRHVNWTLDQQEKMIDFIADSLQHSSFVKSYLMHVVYNVTNWALIYTPEIFNFPQISIDKPLHWVIIVQNMLFKHTLNLGEFVNKRAVLSHCELGKGWILGWYDSGCPFTTVNESYFPKHVRRL